jgi:hypothetical protein
MTMPSTQHRAVVEALAELDDVDEIADHLYDLGHIGVREEPAACPVALYVQAVADVDVLIRSETWEFDPPGEAGTGGMVPPRVGDFVVAYDRGEHPRLDRMRAS